MIGFDTASAITGIVLDRAKAKNVGFVCVYLKWMQHDVLRMISDHGMQIVSVFESGAQRALDGAAGGNEDGAKAVTTAAQFGQSEGSAIYATVDFGETQSQDATVMSYLRAFKAALGGKYKLGVYAEGAVCYLAKHEGIADYTWVAGGRAMRGTTDFLAAHDWTMAQDVGDKQNLGLGISIDSDISSGTDIGGWVLGPAADARDDIADTILLLQTQLRDAGFYNGELDKDPGPETLAAITAWRKRGR